MLSHYRGIALQYGVDAARLPPELRRAFVGLDADESTRAWIDDALVRRRPYARMALRAAAMSIVNIYDANGWTNICKDRLLGTAQWQRVLEHANFPTVGAARGRLLDVGAGDGVITRALAALFDEVVTTEVSIAQARRLRSNGFTCHRCDITFEAIDDPRKFDVVALQNVIDRASHPLRLIDRAGELLADGGRLIVAVPLPIDPVVFRGPTRMAPAERLPVAIGDFETTVTSLCANVFVPRGYRVAALARAPYLCNGSARARVELRDDAIFVLAR